MNNGKNYKPKGFAKVTVVTGYYNRKDVLESTILSILNQTFSDLELIVFDDASTDGSGEELEKIAARLNDPRLRVIRHPVNIGFTRGMIHAIESSDSQYIAVQGSGDISLPQRLEKQVAYLDRDPELGAVGCYYTNVVADSGVRRAREKLADGATVESLIKENNFSHGEVMMRRSAYEAVGGYRAAFVNSQDIDLWLRIAKRYKLGTVPEHLYDRYVRMDGVSYSPLKFANQARYSMLARRFARMELGEVKQALAKLERDGPGALVPQNDSELQRRIVTAVLRSIVWGATGQAEILARKNVTSSWRKLVLVSLARAMGSKLASPLLFALQRIFKIS